MKTSHLLALTSVVLLPWAVTGQAPVDSYRSGPRVPDATPAASAASADATPPLTNPVSLTGPLATPIPATPPTLTPAPAAAPALAPVPTAVPTPPPIVSAAEPPPAPGISSNSGGIRLNFQNASLSDVLNYLSEAAGFVVVQETPVTGTINIVSRQPLTAEEAVDSLNSALIEKGYTAIRTGRILKVVLRKDAAKRDLPVAAGSDPEKIPRKDEMITQILPLHYGEAAKLMENLRPLLSDNSTISANESANSLILTDTQTNVNRIARIITAIDTSVSGISTIKVFPLTHADAKELADVITQLFSPTTGQQGNQQGGFPGGGGFGGGGRRGGFGGFPGFPGMPGMTGQQTPQSEAKQAASRVVAVADQQSNSLIVTAPEEVIPTIKEIVMQVDTSVTATSEVHIFRLQHADAVETAAIITNLYSDTPTSGTTPSSSNTRGGTTFARPTTTSTRSGSSGGTGQSQRELQEAKVTAVGDPRTNTLVVTASHDSMQDIVGMVEKLDEGDYKRQRVFVYNLQHADPENVANILRNLFNDTSAGPTQSRLNARITTGADTTDADSFDSSATPGSR